MRSLGIVTTIIGILSGVGILIASQNPDNVEGGVKGVKNDFLAALQASDVRWLNNSGITMNVIMELGGEQQLTKPDTPVVAIVASSPGYYGEIRYLSDQPLAPTYEFALTHKYPDSDHIVTLRWNITQVLGRIFNNDPINAYYCEESEFQRNGDTGVKVTMYSVDPTGEQFNVGYYANYIRNNGSRQVEMLTNLTEFGYKRISCSPTGPLCYGFSPEDLKLAKEVFEPCISKHGFIPLGEIIDVEKEVAEMPESSFYK